MQLDLSKVTIEKTIPAPMRGLSKRALLFPFFTKIEVGHSFAIDVPSDASIKQAIYLVRQAAADYRRAGHPTFFCTVARDEDKQAVRCWRIAECGNPAGAKALENARKRKAEKLKAAAA